MVMTCPCCKGADVQEFTDNGSGYRCQNCAHVWREATLSASYYAACAGRNENRLDLEKKYTDRINCITRYLRPGQRVLEIGCADGTFGAQVKQQLTITYVGIEPSPDVRLATRRLDKVHLTLAGELDLPPFDLLLAFHVLEHIEDIAAEIGHWRRLCHPDARLIVEVPHHAGNRLLGNDRHPEHLHQFSLASLASLLAHAGLTIVEASTGHFESAVYNDSLRIVARLEATPEQNRQELLARFAASLAGPFVIYGVGGDFRNYVEPLLGELPVAALCDGSTERQGKVIGQHRVAAYDPAALAGLPILIASTRHAGDIRKSLLAKGAPQQALVSLEQIYG
jgi:SAM-dependent methyltransferase